MSTPIYLDNASTTPLDPRVLERMVQCLSDADAYGNASAVTHAFGDEAYRRIEEAREQVAHAVGCEPDDVIWTSGATEADNLAIAGVAHYYRDRGRHIVTTRIEHRAVLDAVKALQRDGWSVSYLEPDANGVIAAAQVAEAITAQTTLVSVMHINNEIGAIQDCEAIAQLCAERGVAVHIDAAQSVGKATMNLRRWPGALVAFSAHKAYGPKGVGALVVPHRGNVHLRPLHHGGGQERGLRSGTLPTHQIVGMGAAFEIAARECEADAARARASRDRLYEGLSSLGGVWRNGDETHCAPQFLNVSFEGVEGESLIADIRDRIAVSAGAACSSAAREPSPVLRALGRTPQLAESSLRFALGRFNSAADVDDAAAELCRAVRRLRRIGGSSP